MTEPVDVRGGAGGIAADCEDILVTALLLGSTAGRAGDAALDMHAELAAAELNGGAVLDPIGAARFGGSLLVALDGPGGLTELAVQAAALSVSLRAAAIGYRETDQLLSVIRPFLLAQLRLPVAVAQLGGDFAVGRFGDGLQAFVTADPELVSVTVGQLASVGIGPAAGGRLYPDGHAVITARGTPAGGRPAPPRSVADLVSGLAGLDDSRQDGDVDVHILTGADAAGRPTRKVVVDIPGTGLWDLPVGGTKSDVTGMGTNLRALAGEPTTYEAGVLAAMRAAGVRPDDEVLLVGHSQGAMIAVNAARDAAASGEFAITHVITAGGPIGGLATAVPSRVQVLALENDGDVVPELDGTENPDRTNVTTATVHHQHGAVEADHSLDESYVPGARDVDASSDPSLRAYVDSLSGFLGADDSQTLRFAITRAR